MEMNFIEHHIIDCIRAAVAEIHGEDEKANRLRSQAKLRLVCMSDEELWELASQKPHTHNNSIEDSFTDLKETVERYKATTDQWLTHVFSRMQSDPLV